MLKTVLRNLIISLSPGIIIGCAGKPVMIMQAPLVSVTKSHIPKGRKMTEQGTVNISYCASETPRLTDDQSFVGLVDEAIYKAQKYGRIDFITDARIYRTGGGCYRVKGNLASLN